MKVTLTSSHPTVAAYSLHAVRENRTDERVRIRPQRKAYSHGAAGKHLAALCMVRTDHAFATWHGLVRGCTRSSACSAGSQLSHTAPCHHRPLRAACSKSVLMRPNPQDAPGRTHLLVSLPARA